MSMTILFVVIGFLCCGYVVSVKSTYPTITRVIIFTFTDWLFTHIVISGLLFWINIYSIKKCTFGVMALWGLIAFCCAMKKEKPSVSFDIKKEWMVFLVALVALPFISTKFDFFGMGQDEGVYQTQAILFMNGITDINIDFEEIDTLDSEEEIEKFVEATGKLAGFYKHSHRTELPGIQAKNITSKNVGSLHGVPTFSALLALWGKLFGMENMQGINTAIFVCILFIIFYICQELSLNKTGTFTALFIYAISPLVIWTNKSALTETTFTLIMVCYLYCILKSRKQDAKYAVRSALCIVTLGYFHVSIYAFMPLFVLLYLAMWLFYQCRDYLYSMILSVFGYLSGFWMMYMVSTVYTSDNYRFVYHAFINSSIMPYFVTGVSILVILAGVLLLRCRKGFSFSVSGISSSKSSVCYKLVYAALVAVAAARCFLQGMNWQQIPNITLAAYAIVTGGVVMALVYLSTFLNTKWWLSSFQRCLILAMFTYCILIYSALFKNWINYYYYYARYLTMFIPLIAIMGGMLLNCMKAWKGILIVGLSAMILLPYDWCLLTEQDDSRLEWGTLVSIADELDSDDSVILTENSLYRLFYFPLKALTGANIYPAFDEDLSEQISALAEISDDVYVLSKEDETEADSVTLTVDIRVKNKGSEDSNSLEKDYQNPNHSSLLQLPLTFNESIQTYTLYKLKK